MVPKTLKQTDADLVSSIHDFVVKSVPVAGGKREFVSDAVWRQLRNTGTEIWLDTGDLDGAATLWRDEMSALTTNNTLLFKEVDKGIYDDLTRETIEILGSQLEPQTAVIELAFILNAHHGLRLVDRFGADVSVELHTDLANDVEATLHYARRYHAICPERFIVKVPLTPAGIMATRTLRDDGVRINMTLGFSARQNTVAAIYCRPDYLNVFLGRLNAYVQDNGLGNGELVGEKATLASQRALHTINARAGRPSTVRQIAASMRSADQVPAMAGVDVHTIPLPAASGVLESPPSEWSTRIDDDPTPGIDPEHIDGDARIGQLWNVEDDVVAFGDSLDTNPPSTPLEVVERARSTGLEDLFPTFSDADLDSIASAGKIPDHAFWSDRIAKGEVAADSLLNAAGLAAFAKDQAALDDRIRGLMQ